MSNQSAAETTKVEYKLLGPEDIEKRAAELARSHSVIGITKFPNWLLTKMNTNYRYILHVYQAISAKTGESAASSPIAEWLLDNFYIIEEQVKDIKHHVHKKHFAYLPILKNDYQKAYPRIYALAVDLVQSTDGMIDERTLINFIKVYQVGQPLNMGELWAMPVMLRIALIEKISDICHQLSELYQRWEEARQFAEQIFSALEKGNQAYAKLIDEKIDIHNAISSAFLEKLVKILRRKGKNSALVLGYLDLKLDEAQTGTEKLINLEHQIQVARQVSIGNAITGIRMVAASDWNEIFECLSKVEDILSKDPSGYYPQMDFESRDHYRHVVEEMARLYGISEIKLAQIALNCAQKSQPGELEQEQTNHVGYYLISSGRTQLEQSIKIKPHGIKAALKYIKGYPYLVYFLTLAIFILLMQSSLLRYAADRGTSWVALFFIGLLLLVPLSEIALNIINFGMSRLYAPARLPKLELKSGIPPELSTMVIVPTLLPAKQRVMELLGKLEVYYLANKEQNLYFALVGDFVDAAAQELAEDSEIVTTSLEGIEKLNRKYAREKPVFYYFHRSRQYNTTQDKWLGWERKRGAVVELNDLLSGVQDTSFTAVSCAADQLPSVKYIITLDADTNIPMGSAKRLIGTMAHPLNRPVIANDRKRVIKGYGLLQPRIGVSMDSANKTLFARIFAGQGGIDPYTTAISDVYQDVFNEGIFTGKGIYELATFQAVIKDAIPQNSVLSHDLLEGSYARAGLVTDIELIDGYPARYNSFTMRLHRWVRGDWQLLPWLGTRVKDRQGEWRRNPLTALSKWKIIDNLRRSLLSPTLVTLILLGFSSLPGNYLVWEGLALIVLAMPMIIHLINAVFVQEALLATTKGQTVINGFRASLYQTALQYLFVAYQAYIMVDAIVRTLIRLYITRKNLLEWIPAADVEITLKSDLLEFYRKMLVSPVLGIVLPTLVLRVPNSFPAVVVAFLVGVMWAAAPYTAYRLSQEYVRKQQALSAADEYELRRLARKSWAYYEDLVTAEENHLPPDNYQVEPFKGSAHRTSPTNIGLYLVALLAARDFGYLGTSTMLEKIEQTLSSIEKMEKWEGHLYNWYDTQTLNVLRPRYVSTVDSGNLVGYLIVLAEGLRDYQHQAPAVQLDNQGCVSEEKQDCLGRVPAEKQFAQGLLDTIYLFNEENDSTESVVPVEALENYLNEAEPDAQGWRELLAGLQAALTNPVLQDNIAASRWGKRLASAVRSYQLDLLEPREIMQEKIEALLVKLRILIDNTRFSPLFDAKRQLFSIGFNVEEGLLTKSYYDLLASEARLASYLAIARGEVEQRHWYRLGRKLTQVEGLKGLVSWTGTMFEYFMPLLIMRSYENSILEATYSFVVKAQQAYGERRRIPWGVSESAYYAFDLALNYQYKAFGVPELGFKRGLGNELVVAPYATVLALAVDPKGVMANLQRLKPEMDGEYGLYEAIDYTASRVSLDQKSSVVKNFMVHHQGMSILALVNHFNGNIMQNRFHADPVIKSAELLLQERMPYRVGIIKEHREEYRTLKRKAQDEPEVVREYGLPKTELPPVHLLANENYSVMLTAGGSGYSKKSDLAVSRWQEGWRGSNLGFYVFVQNINANIGWSATYEPYRQEPEAYRVVFSPDKAEFFRKDGNIETHTQIVVSAEDNAEIRKVALTNNSQHSRVLEITSYFEVVLTHPDADLAHPAFSNLFVTTEYVPEYECLLAVRRSRHTGQLPVWAVHTVTVEGGQLIGDAQYETDRAKFIGRNRSLTNPQAMEIDHPLANTVGAVLDPIMSLRKRVRIEAGQTVRVAYCLAVSDQRQKALTFADKYRDVKAVDRAFEFAWNRSQIEAGFLAISAKDMETYLEIIPSILFPGPARLKWEQRIMQNKKGQPGLWPFGISGDIPIVLVHVEEENQIDLIYQVLKAHELWRVKGLQVDLVLLAEDESGYVQPLQEAIREAISASHAREMQNRRGGVYMLNAHQMAEDEVLLLYTTARLALKGNAGSLAEQIQLPETKLNHIPVLKPKVPAARTASSSCTLPQGKSAQGMPKLGQASGEIAQEIAVLPVQSQLLFNNGIGGFNLMEKEYAITLREGQSTPAPWINVIANPKFGFNITESGAGYTWAENSRENKLTPWYNDPVTDRQGEVFYLRDEQSGIYWSITPMPIRDEEDYLIRHGRGYTIFEHHSQELRQELTEFAAVADSVKICLVKLSNLSTARRELSITHYIRPVLGVNDKVSAPFITTALDEAEGTLLFSNSFNSDFPGRIAFMATSEKSRTYTTDGQEFFGVQGSLEQPAALEREHLSGRVGGGLDPCGAMQVKISLQPAESRSIVFLLGQGDDLPEVQTLVTKYNSVMAAEAELSKVRTLWQEKLEVLQVKTPDKSMDILLNSWLQYQVIACRLWSRAAFYQSGGAYGFRDQLQDVMAVAYSWPELTRKQILLHSAHQFKEGDVQHWWHPGADKGIRTRYSDDFLWLPYVTADYIESTADWSVLDEVTPFLEEEPLPAHEDERYNTPEISEEKKNIYIHCIRAIENALRFGEHGIPLMGSGDWNDGMNTVGNKGRGESVWLGWFLYTVLQKFIPICKERRDNERADRYAQVAVNIADSIEQHAWDGSWYRRAYFDDGTPLGSAGNKECKIDAIAQSWSVISGIGRPHRAKEAMQAVDNYLVDKEAGIIKLLTPPFGEGQLQPGYIKAYVPGVRENGGQYTHAAVWTILAFAKLGHGDKVQELFSLINPINHSRTLIEAMRYKAEPYVVAADVYAVHPNTGRGGWSWYTGAAGWMYRVGIENILGIKKVGSKLCFNPCIPKNWPEFQVEYKLTKSSYQITVLNPNRVNQGVCQVLVNGAEVIDKTVHLVDDGKVHRVEVIMGRADNVE